MTQEMWLTRHLTHSLPG